MSKRYDSYQELCREGLVNTDIGDLRDLIDDEEDEVRVTYCSSHKCAYKSTSRKGRAISVGEHLKACPHCDSGDALFLDVVGRVAASRLKQVQE